jgi:ATP-dependent 26S proteasome regulatory subunit
MLVKAVANATKASFIRVVGSEFVQKYLGEVRSTSLSCIGLQGY